MGTTIRLDEDFARDPYPVYAHMRRESPVYRAELPGGTPVWMVTRYDDVRVALADPRLSKEMRFVEKTAPSLSSQAAQHSEVFLPFLGEHMLDADPPRHTRLRKLVNKAFTVRQVERLRPLIEQATESLLDAITPLGEADLVKSFALPLPLSMVCDLMGFPTQDHDKFSSWVSQLLSNAMERDEMAIRKPAKEFIAYCLHQIRLKRRHPDEDLLSALVQVCDDGNDQFSKRELLSTIFLMVAAGHETTANLLGNGILALLRNPEQMTLLHRYPALIPAAVEEFLRYDSPVTTSTYRFAREAVEIGGVTIPAGEVVLVSIGSACRDPQRFADPDRLDIGRDTRGHLAFGHGIHYCLGAPLARLEGAIAFEALLRRLPDLELAVPLEQLRWRPSVIFRGPLELPVRFTPTPVFSFPVLVGALTERG